MNTIDMIDNRKVVSSHSSNAFTNKVKFRSFVFSKLHIQRCNIYNLDENILFYKEQEMSLIFEKQDC